ncbi:MAG: transposase [Athalassotoga sp.]|uniref:transposase n=1 Tax=Athalassotoga sp. TaxID=2022597 RepID=UPI003CFEC09D
MVDTQGLLLEVLVHPGNISDRIGGALLLNKFKESGEYPNIKIIWVDRGYKWFKLIEYAKNKWNIEISVVERPQIRRIWWPKDEEPPEIDKSFKVLPRRWVVERSFAWMDKYRRLSKDYEYLTLSSEAMIMISVINLMIKRLAGIRRNSCEIPF